MSHWNSAGFSFPINKRNRFFASSLRFSAAFAIMISALAAAINPRPVYAAANLTIMPITWNVVGLDSNKVTDGPENFPVGARVCNTGDAAATNLSADFVWDTTDPYINLRPGSLDPITLSSLAAGACHDFYFEVSIMRDAAAYDNSADYHITVTADGGISAQTPANREIYVEHLVSQNRNSVLDILLDGVSVPAGGAMNLNIGQTYNIQLIASTATNGYEQIESFINFPNTIFLVNSVATTYTAYPTPHTDLDYATKLYADGCTWNNDTTSGTYRSCLGVGKYGDTVTIDYNVTIVASSASSGTLNTLIYDFSGSSYHYNSDFALAARVYNILNPSSCTQSIIAQWNFDSSLTAPSTDNAVGNPSISATGLSVASSVLGNPASGQARYHTSWGTGGLNLSDNYLQFNVSTEGYYNVQFSYDVFRTNSGPKNVTPAYDDDGGGAPTALTADALDNVDSWYSLGPKDLSAFPSMDNVTGARFMLYGHDANNTGGAMRVDNITVTGCKLPSGLNLDKEGSPAYFTAAGQTVTYTYTLTNSGQVSLQAPYTITDDKVAPANISCAGAASPLAPGDSTTCAGTYITTAADVASASVTNLATAASTTVIGDPVTSNQAVETVEFQIANFGHVPSNYLGMNLYNDGGAMHLSGTTMFGASLTSATDGINTAAYTPKASDDGVTYTPSVAWTAGGAGSVDITAACPSAPCYMNAWIDWNKDGDFNDPGEQIFTDQTLNDGTVTLTFNIPASVTLDGVFYSRFRIYDQMPTGAQPNGAAMDGVTPLYGEIEDPFFNISGGVVTPVTLSWFKAERQGNQINFAWSTATETGNVGFNLYVEHGDNLALINAEMIPSSVIDSLDQQNYSFSAAADGDIFYIEDVSVTGETRRHGPFALGEEFGARLEADKIDWTAVAADRARQNPLQPDLRLVAGQAAALHLKVRQSGLYRVSYETLRAAGLDLNGVPAANLQLSLNGRAQPIRVSTTGAFGPGAYIEFYGRALNSLYTDTNVYTLKVGASRPVRIAVNRTPLPRGVKAVASYQETLVVNNQRAYANYSPSAEAWYDTSMLVYTSPKSWDFPFEINGLANASAAAALELTVWGVTNWPQSPDHHLQASVNGIAVADVTFDGLTERVIKVNLPGGALREGANNLRLTLPGDSGVKYELVNLDKFTVTYARKFQARDGRLAFTSAGPVFRVTNLPSRNVVVYRLENNRPVRLGRVTVKASGSAFTATFAGSISPDSNSAATYLVSTVEALYAPALEAAPASVNLDQPADYLIISHPDFIGGLQPLIAARQAQGLSVGVVNVNDLYAKYTYGVFDAKAIQRHIAYAAQNLGTRSVLLVGGDTYDYRNYLGVNSVSFIPSLYASTGPLVRFVPSDPLYTDLNGDKVPDLAIGRFPVRSAAELEMMVNKTLAYQNKDYGRTSLFVADKMDGLLSFKGISQDMAASLPSGWASESVHLEDFYRLDAEGKPYLDVSAARTQLIDAMNRGTALVTFTGHSGPSVWTFSSLFNTGHAAALTNAGRPFVAVQWGCWNTYYVDPVNTSLVQSLLFSGDRGAAAALGASTLTDSQSEKLLGQYLTPRLVTPGVSIGQALQDAKQELAQTHPELLDVLLGWSLMGDPALVIEP